MKSENQGSPFCSLMPFLQGDVKGFIIIISSELSQDTSLFSWLGSLTSIFPISIHLGLYCFVILLCNEWFKLVLSDNRVAADVDIFRSVKDWIFLIHTLQRIQQVDRRFLSEY